MQVVLGSWRKWLTRARLATDLDGTLGSRAGSGSQVRDPAGQPYAAGRTTPAGARRVPIDGRMASQASCTSEVMSDSIERLAFELGVEALREQERALAELRTRAAAVLATGSVVASLAAARGSRTALAGPALFGMSAFVLGFGGAILVMLPRGFVFSLDGPAMLQQLDWSDRDDHVAIAYREAGLSLARYGRENGAATPARYLADRKLLAASPRGRLLCSYRVELVSFHD